MLKTNFRSTNSIHTLADRFRSPEEEGDNSSTFREGPPPELFTAEKTDDLYALLEQRICFLIEVLEYDPENIFVLIPNSRFEKKVSAAIKNAGFDTVNVKSESFDFMESRAIRMAPLPSSKGLDMPVVLLFLPCLFATDSDSYDEESTEKLRRNLLYVCMTRAMDMLNVFMKEEAEDQILGDLRQAFRESLESDPVN